MFVKGLVDNDYWVIQSESLNCHDCIFVKELIDKEVKRQCTCGVYVPCIYYSHVLLTCTTHMYYSHAM